ncbi:hypothetical protein C5E45_01250 [Nocardia nova]|uniref:Uncharacterized protein n=1 Tax=Nocardia nova TaxID=37330 RepID=A0A2S6AX68_9NOCA|nr:hypothetical protein [Nocardia nova]PPJ34382.1 hypothetical protein C5E41_02200 [Nocardia nova]PPJ39798.1 hypothetical protein C5E45_01250 [Nocardia nova]
MNIGWVAGDVRAVGLAQRRFGAAGARRLAEAGSLAAAQQMLLDHGFRHRIHVGADLAETEHVVSAAVLWHLRILAGWQPSAGFRLLRALAGGFETANIQGLASSLAGGEPTPAYELGALGWAWEQLREAKTLTALREALRGSVWGDPGSARPADIADSAVLAWATRMGSVAGGARDWAAGVAALVVARRHVLQRSPLPGPALRSAALLLGSAAVDKEELPALVAVLPARARWVLDGLDTPSQLWRGEVRWWIRVETDGAHLLAGSRFGPDKPVGAFAVSIADVWRVRSALEVAAGVAGIGARDELA